MSDNDVSVTFGAQTADLNSAVAQARNTINGFAASIKSAFAKVDASGVTDGFKATTDGAKQSSDQVESSAQTIKDGFEKITLGAGAALLAVTASLLKTGDQAVALGEQIRAAAGAFDQSTASMSNVKAVADRSGLSLDELGKSFGNLQSKARSGDDGVVAALKAIGLNAREVGSLSQDTLAVKMAQTFSTAKDSANKAAAGVALFGDSAAKIVPQLDMGAARMKGLEDAADRAGVVIGPDLAARIEGSNAVIQTFKDRLQELKLTFEGGMLQTFAELKPAIDGVRMLMADVVGNVASLIEWLEGLDGAGRKNAQTMGLLGTAAKWFTEAIIDATTYVEELAVKGVQRLGEIGISLSGLSSVAQAFGKDLALMATTSANALHDAFQAAIGGVISMFGDLATAGKKALSFDFSGVHAAFTTLGDDAQATKAKIKAAMSPEMFGNTKAAIDAMRQGAAAYAKSLDGVTASLEKQKAAEIALVEAGGASGSPVGQTRAVGNPAAPDTSGNNAKLEAAIKELDGEVEAARNAERQKAELLDAGVELHQLTEGQKVAATRAALDAEFAAEKAAYDKELALDGLKPQQHQQILNKLQQADAAYHANVLKLQIQAAEEIQKTWDQAMSSINSAFTGQIDGLLKGTTSLKQAFRSAFASMIEDAIKFCAEWALKQAETIAQNILGINAQTDAQIAGAAAGTAAQTAGAVASSVATLGAIAKNIAASASEAFAGVFGFLSPVLGPAAAGPAAAAEATVMGVLPKFDAGAWSLPSDMVAQVHRGEMIVPAAQTPWAQSLMSNAAGGGSGGGGGDTHNWNISAIDAQSFIRMLKSNSSELAKAVGAAMARNPGTRGAY